MTTNPVKYFTEHPTAANLLMIVFIVIGIMTMPSIQRETFPRFVRGAMQVVVAYPGASSEDIESAVCQPIEDAMDQVTNIEDITCKAQENSGVAVIEWNDGGEFSAFKEDVKTQIEAINNFPDESEDPVITEMNRTDHVATVAVTGPEDPRQLKAYAEFLKDRMLQSNKISQVSIGGFADRQIRIEIPAANLQQYGLSISDISSKISRQSVDLPSGTIETGDEDVLIRFADERKSVQELAELLIISGTSGGEVRLGDIAFISDIFEDNNSAVTYNGKRAAILNISKTVDQDSIRVGNAIDAFVEQEQKEAPESIGLHITNDAYTIVIDRLNLLLNNGWQGFLLAFMVLWLFFNVRFAFWVAMGLPISFLGTFFFMELFGLTINMMTMVGLLVSIGLIMDDAIVISENIATKLEKGMGALEAAIKGTQEVGPGVLSSFLTTVFMFAPLAFLDGRIGTVLGVVAIVLIMTLAVSLAEAFLIMPHHMFHSLHNHEKDKIGKYRQKFEDAFEKFRSGIFRKSANWAVDNRYLFSGLLIGLVFVTFGLMSSGLVKFQAFPSIEGNRVEARILMPQGTPLLKTERIIQRVLTALNQTNETGSAFQNQDQSLVQAKVIQYSANADAGTSGPHMATIIVDLLKSEERSRKFTVNDFINEWRDNTGHIPGVIQMNFTESTMGPSGKPIEINLYGSDYNELKKGSLALQNWLNRVDGVADVFDNLRPGKKEIRLRLREGAMALGLDAMSIAGQLRSAYLGSKVSEIQIRDETYEIEVRLAEADRNRLDTLETFTITTPTADKIPLITVAYLEEERGYSVLNRVNGKRTITVEGNVDRNRVNVNQLMKQLKFQYQPEWEKQFPKLTMEFRGEVKEGSTTQQSMASMFLLGIFLIFALLSLQFKSYKEPLIVMLAIPFGIVGMIWGHLIMGINISLISMLGGAAIAGVVVNDSILVVTFLKIRISEGMNVYDAAKQASHDRLRPVLLTTLTTIAGMVPLLFESSLQAQVLIPLVTSMIFGELFSTAVILLMIPSLYAIFEDFGLTAKFAKSS